MKKILLILLTGSFVFPVGAGIRVIQNGGGSAEMMTLAGFDTLRNILTLADSDPKLFGLNKEDALVLREEWLPSFYQTRGLVIEFRLGARPAGQKSRISGSRYLVYTDEIYTSTGQSKPFHEILIFLMQTWCESRGLHSPVLQQRLIDRIETPEVRTVVFQEGVEVQSLSLRRLRISEIFISKGVESARILPLIQTALIPQGGADRIYLSSLSSESGHLVFSIEFQQGSSRFTAEGSMRISSNLDETLRAPVFIRNVRALPDMCQGKLGP